MASYPQEHAQDAVCQSHTGHRTGLWFLPTRPLRLNNNEWMRIPLIKLTVFLEESLIYWFGIFYSLFCRTFMDVSEMRLRYCVPPESDTSWKTMFFMISSLVDSVWNVMAHAQKPDFVFRWNGRVHLNRRGGVSSVELLAAEVCWIHHVPR